MKTILYQPLFTNPQAYFVFPQLYHIEKGDSYIEPANITGQLIIQSLSCNTKPTEDNSILLVDSTPILLIDGEPLLLASQNTKQVQYDYTSYKYTNSIDFDRFKGCHIRISQYTNIGAVVLGEWYIPDTPTLPEPEQPQKPDENDILKSLIVHYNVGKQGSNNIKTTSTLTDYSGNNRNATCKNFDWNTIEFVDEGKAMRFDGNGSCIVAVDMPQIDKYTLIVKRRWIDKRTENKWFCSLGSGDYTSASQSLFWFEGGLLNNVFYTYNRGYKNPIVLPELISIQSSDDYNGTRINASDGIQASNKLFIGSIGENDNTHVVADFYQLLLFDRVLTDAEREWVKENMIEPDTVSAAKACSALFEPENLEITGEFPNGVIRDSLGGNYYLLPHSSGYTIENGLMKSTDNTFLVSIENANENDVKAMMVDMYYDSTVPGSYLNGEYTEGSVKLLNRRIKVIKNWSPLTSISTFGFRATDNQIEFAGSTDGGTMSYILDDTDVTKFTIEYTNTAGEGNVYLMIGDKQYDVISGQLQTYSVSGAVKLDFLNMEEVTNFAGTIKFTNVN